MLFLKDMVFDRGTIFFETLFMTEEDQFALKLFYQNPHHYLKIVIAAEGITVRKVLSSGKEDLLVVKHRFEVFL